MKKLSHAEIASRRLTPAQALETARLPLVAVVESVRSLYNVGSIFRTSDGAMIEKLILAGFSPYPPRKEIDKTALGATTTVPWEYHRDPASAIGRLKEEGYTIAALELAEGSIDYAAVTKNRFPLCLIVGNEVTGVSKELLNLCDLALEIPMFGTKQSLNVAVAYGIAVFELSRVWRTGTNI